MAAIKPYFIELLLIKRTLAFCLLEYMLILLTYFCTDTVCQKSIGKFIENTFYVIKHFHHARLYNPQVGPLTHVSSLNRNSQKNLYLAPTGNAKILKREIEWIKIVLCSS